MNEREPVRLSRLFLDMLTISAFTFGGGFVIAGLMKKRFVDQRGWIAEEEMLDIVALAQASPGAIAVNVGILTGWQLAGLTGMAVSVLGIILPPMVILSLVSVVYEYIYSNALIAVFLQGLKIGVVAVLADVVLGLIQGLGKEKRLLRYAVIAAAFTASCFFHISVVLILLCAILAGVVSIIYEKRRIKA